ncbi:MAG TPA: hypothetical protein VN751_14280 [Solirubrobacteraceae bacterium]|nr:hypothetical protein [Solirubrobacteraceae bacterium]
MDDLEQDRREDERDEQVRPALSGEQEPTRPAALGDGGAQNG